MESHFADRKCICAFILHIYKKYNVPCHVHQQEIIVLGKAATLPDKNVIVIIIININVAFPE